MGTGFRGRNTGSPAWLAALDRALLAILPALAVAVVAATVLVVGRPRPVLGARVRGGPTGDAPHVSFRLEIVRRSEGIERAVVGRTAVVEARKPSTSASLGSKWSGILDAEGAAAVELRGLGGPTNLRIVVGEELVADAPVTVPAADWLRGAHRRGGWVDGRPERGLRIRAAAERGAFAVPFRDGLLVEVHRDGAVVPGAAIRASAEGADIDPREAVADVRGRARFVLGPREHAVSVVLSTRATDGAEARLELSPAIVPGAFRAELAGDRLRVASPILRERAYVAVVTDRARVAGGTVLLTADGLGGAAGELAFPGLPEGPLWAVVSSEPDLGSGGLVGWPLRAGLDVDVPTTFDVPDVVWLDTMEDAAHREERRVGKARVFAAAFAALTLALTALLVGLRARRAGRRLETHLAEAGAETSTSQSLTEPAGGWLALGVLSLLLGAALIGLFALWR